MPMQAPSRRRKRRSPLLFPAACLLFLLLGVLLGRHSMAAAIPADPTTPAPASPAVSADASAPAVPQERADASIPDGLRQAEGDVHSGTLILVSNDVPYVFPEDQPLSNVLAEKNDSYFVRDSTVDLAPEALEALNRMMADFTAQGGPKQVNVVAGYRTESFQQHLFDQSAAANGLAHAQRYVAQPGGSEHHTGYALDFALYYPESGASGTFDGTGDFRWIADYAAEYGFTLRYPAGKEAVTGIGAESWHYRYVGLPHAALMAEHGLCLEEYIDFLRQYPCGGTHLLTESGGQAYEIYFCAADALYVPAAGIYSVSGNNVDGFIVTISL